MRVVRATVFASIIKIKEWATQCQKRCEDSKKTC